DEITELAPVAQAKLLRALQERAVRPVGGIREIPVAIRFITSTNRDLRGALEEGKLRRDLYYRLQHLVIELPPLRERLEDIPLLAGHFLEQAGGEGLPTPPRGISQEAIAHLEMRPWPGNVRELRSAVRLACQRTSGRRIGVADLSPSLPPERAAAPWPRPREAETLPASSRGARAAAASPVSLLGIEREAIMRALGSTDGNKSRAALLLGISRKQLYVKLRRHGMI
ncbi:MAG: sigma 54-interacting transcriptional regulator, partial [Planctomycetota bacterium]